MPRPGRPRYEAPVRPAPPAAAPPPPPAPPARLEGELTGTVERAGDGRPDWNTTALLDALVELHNPPS